MKKLQNQNLKRSIAAEHVHSYVAFIVSGEQKINSRVSYSQTTNAHLGKKRWQDWLRKYQRLFGSRDKTQAKENILNMNPNLDACCGQQRDALRNFCRRNRTLVPVRHAGKRILLETLRWTARLC
jgi:hypothetical protein